MNFLLLILSLVALAYISQFIVLLFHEFAHKKALKNKGVRAEINWNFLKSIKSLGFGGTINCFFDLEKFNKLNYKSKKKIILAGFYVDVLFATLFIALSLLSWSYWKGSFVWYYFNTTAFIFLIRILTGFWIKGSDFQRWRELKNRKP